MPDVAPGLDRFRTDALTRPEGQNVVAVAIMAWKPGLWIDRAGRVAPTATGATCG
jgi:hypothetical protein